jgi:hypothetical protein
LKLFFLPLPVAESLCLDGPLKLKLTANENALYIKARENLKAFLAFSSIHY